MLTHAPRLLTILALTAPLACSDGGGESTDATSASASNPTATPGSAGSTGSTGELPPTTGDAPTQGSMTAATDSSATTEVDPSATATTVDPSASASATTDMTGSTGSTGSTGPDCACEPGSTDVCEAGGLLTCKADCSGFEAVPCPQGQNCVGDACSMLLCQPGQSV